MGDSERIREINYQIKRLELDIKNLHKTIETKRRNRFLDTETELDLKEQIENKKADIAGLQAEIRKIENSALRSSNTEDGIDLDTKAKRLFG